MTNVLNNHLNEIQNYRSIAETYIRHFMQLHMHVYNHDFDVCCFSLKEQVSEVLEKWIKQDLDSENYGEESVFNSTITNEWGQEIARRIRRQSEGEDRKPDHKPEAFTGDSNVIEAQVNANVGKEKKIPRVLQIHKDMGQDQ